MAFYETIALAKQPLSQGNTQQHTDIQATVPLPSCSYVRLMPVRCGVSFATRRTYPLQKQVLCNQHVGDNLLTRLKPLGKEASDAIMVLYWRMARLPPTPNGIKQCGVLAREILVRAKASEECIRLAERNIAGNFCYATFRFVRAQLLESAASCITLPHFCSCC